MTHPYEEDSQSGAGNCTCGAAEHHRRHPHTYLRAWFNDGRCVCGLTESDPTHYREER